MLIRLMNHEDIPDVLRLWNETPGIGLNDEDDNPVAIARFLTRNAASCFVATSQDDDPTTGSNPLLGCIISGHDGRRATIYHLAVSVNARRRGIGAALVDSCMKSFADEGIVKARIYVFASNVTGNAFWESIGFTTRDDLVLRNRNV